MYLRLPIQWLVYKYKTHGWAGKSFVDAGILDVLVESYVIRVLANPLTEQIWMEGRDCIGSTLSGEWHE